MDCLCCVNRGIGPASDTDFLGSLCKLKSSDGVTDAKFPAVPHRYALYVVAGCPFAARPWTVLSFYGLTNAIPIIKCFPASFQHGWFLEPRSRGEEELVHNFPDAQVDACPQGCHHLSQLYYQAAPDYKGAISVPLLWDSVENTVVSNSSFGLAEMIATQMRDLATRNQHVHLYPTSADEYKKHDALVKFLHVHVTTAVYQMNNTDCGRKHDRMVDAYYNTLEELQERLDSNGPFLMGSEFRFADIVFFISLVRLDLAYQWRFGLGRKNVRDNYPTLWTYVQQIMNIPGINESVLPRDVMALYFMTEKFISQGGRTLPQVPETWQNAMMNEKESHDDENDCKRRQK